MPKTLAVVPARAIHVFSLFVWAGLMFAGPGVLMAASHGASPQAKLIQSDDDEPVLLTDEDVNLIQVYEIDLETEPRVIVDRDRLEKFLDDDQYAGRDGMPRGRREIRDFLRAEGWEQLELLFEMRARDYYGAAQVREEPGTLRAWQRLNTRYINAYFLKTFANQSLGEETELRYQGREIDEIPLVRHGRNSKQIAYTNFYILTQMTADGIPFIDRDRPEESLLLQWSLPREDAQFSAPEVEGWQPRFRSLDDNDPRRDDLLEWIASLEQVNQGSRYDIEFLPPGLEEADEE